MKSFVAGLGLVAFLAAPASACWYCSDNYGTKLGAAFMRMFKAEAKLVMPVVASWAMSGGFDKDDVGGSLTVLGSQVGASVDPMAIYDFATVLVCIQD